METDFQALKLNKELINVLKFNNIKTPTPIQQQAIPLLKSGRDIIGQAQTGTGKTLAFILPIMEKIDVNEPYVQALVITPTRELALQVTAEFKKLLKAKPVRILAAYGGQDVTGQINKLKGAVHVVIGTPGRLLDHINRKTINLSKLSMLVLDEADQMLDMGFLQDIEKIISNTPKERQTMLFSATMPEEIKKLAGNYMSEPEHISVQGSNITLDDIKQVVIETTDRGKQEALFKTIDEYNPFMAIIFCRTKRRTIALNEALRRNGYNSDELHGDLTQAKREKVMRAFREARHQFLVATDVAARGLDIGGITHIFNYDIPEDPESYIHRIGRTGRAGKTGAAITFVSPKDRRFLHSIERAIKATIEKRRAVKSESEERVLSDDRKPEHRRHGSKPANKGHFRGKSNNSGRQGRYGKGKGAHRGKM